MPTGLEEAASIAGIIGLSFQCLSGCIWGIQLISTALQLGNHANYFRVALLLEEKRLLFWAKRCGLDNEHLDKRLPWTLIKEALENLELLLISTEKFQTRYGLDIRFTDPPTPSKALPKYHSLSTDEFAFFTGEELRAERVKILERGKKMKKNAGMFKKFWFAAVDKDKFRELLQQINYIIQQLHEFLSDQIQDDLKESFENQQLGIINLTTSIHEIQAMIEANSLKNLWTLPETTTALLKFIQLSESSKSQSKDLDTLLSHTVPSHSSLERLSLDRITDTKKFDGQIPQGSVMYKEEQYYAEWKKYDWSTNEAENGEDSTNDKKRVEESIFQLALLLNAPKHPAFCTLECFGIACEERSRQYMFLYKWPTDRGEPKTLRQLLSSSYKPSLDARLKLARDLAKSLFLLHAANWMHKALSSHNVIFFPPADAPSARSLDDPYIVGFAYSRPDKEGEPSQKLDRNPETDIYRHPNCLAEEAVNFHKSYDIYSLGLLLLEIAKWRPLKDIWLPISIDRILRETKKDRKSLSRDEMRQIEKQAGDRCRKEDVQEMQKVLIDKKRKDSHPDDVAFRVGQVFSDVILTCLRSDFDRFRDDPNNPGLQDMFGTKVLKQLEL